MPVPPYLPRSLFYLTDRVDQADQLLIDPKPEISGFPNLKYVGVTYMHFTQLRY